ncbi:MAG: DUF4190 domain-containing protein [Flavobacteriales bacterium]
MRSPILFLAGIALLGLSACSTSHEVVQSGPFQQRKYVNKGWFLELPSARKDKPKPVKETASAMAQTIAQEGAVPDGPVQATWTPGPLDLQVAAMPVEDESAPPAIVPPVKRPAAVTEPLIADDGYGMRATPARKVGAAAAAVPLLFTPRGDNVGGINIFALLGFILAFFIPIAGLILSIIGMKQTSPGDGHGHGLAVAGLIISIVALVVALAIIL